MSRKGRLMRDPRTPQIIDGPGWKMSGARLKEVLGLPPKLGPAPSEPVYVGTVQGVEIWDCPRGTNGKGEYRDSRPHRLHAKIDGGRFVPAGRLHQYRMKTAAPVPFTSGEVRQLIDILKEP